MLNPKPDHTSWTDMASFTNAEHDAKVSKLFLGQWLPLKSLRDFVSLEFRSWELVCKWYYNPCAGLLPIPCPPFYIAFFFTLLSLPSHLDQFFPSFFPLLFPVAFLPFQAPRRYTVLEPVGRGAYGVVCSAQVDSRYALSPARLVLMFFLMLLFCLSHFQMSRPGHPFWLFRFCANALYALPPFPDGLLQLY